MVKAGTLWVKATNSPSGFEVTTDGNGVVGHAGAALLRELADRLGLTRALGWGQQGARRRLRWCASSGSKRSEGVTRPLRQDPPRTVAAGRLVRPIGGIVC